MERSTTPTDKVYKLKRNAAPLSYMLPTRNSKRYPLLWYDEKKNVNRALRYSSNQKSPFEDEQDGNIIIQPIIFENGFLSVPKTNPVLQEFLFYHPMNGKSFVEVNDEKDASEVVEKMYEEVDALVEAKNLTIDQMVTVARVLFGKDVSRMSTAEIKRDIFVRAKKDPVAFLNILKDPNLRMQSLVQSFFDKKLLVYRNNRREVYYNTTLNKKRMMTIPYGEDATLVIGAYLKSDEGIEELKVLEALALKEV